MEFFEFPITMNKKKTRDWSTSKLFKSFVFFAFTLSSIILLPVAIVASPFIFAWQCTKMVTKGQAPKKKTIQPFAEFDPSKWNEMSIDFNSWLNSEDN